MGISVMLVLRVITVLLVSLVLIVDTEPAVKVSMEMACVLVRLGGLGPIAINAHQDITGFLALPAWLV